MQVKMSYFIKYKNGASAWLAVGKEPDGEVAEKQERPMLFPDEGKQLKSKVSGEVFDAIWLKDTTQDDYEEVVIEENKE